MKLNKARKRYASPQLQRLFRKVRVTNWAKSCVWGIVFGLGLSFGYLTLCALFGNINIWFAGICFLGGFAVFAPIVYAVRFRQGAREMASEIDALGLKERVITMMQFAEINSPIACRQRIDTENILQQVKKSHLKVRPFTMLNAFLICALLICNVSSLALVCAMPKPLILIPQTTANQHTVQYTVYNEQGGKILGCLVQKVGENETAGAVQAVATENWIFAGWSDGVETAYREDKNIKKDFCVSAIFMPIDGDNDADDETMPGRVPDKGEENGEDRLLWQTPPGSNSLGGDNESENDGSSDSPTNPNGQVIDGATFIGDIYGSSVSNAMNAAGNAGLSGNQADIVGGYFGGIAK